MKETKNHNIPPYKLNGRSLNDLPNLVVSYVYLFADDTKIFNIISKQQYIEQLQSDLYKLSDWSDTWLLKFHPDKCKHI